MKSTLRIALFSTAMLFFIAACNNGDQNKIEPTTSDTANKITNSSPTTVANTIVTTPQHMLVIKHRVKDFDAWKLAFDSNDSARLANGLHKYVIGRTIDDPNVLVVALKADDINKAKAFASSSALKAIMQKAGVVGTPSFYLTTNTFQDTAKINTTIRSMTMFKIKDWETWEKNFKNGEQERLDNGIVTRVYGYNADNNNEVRLVTALTDTAKARAYWNSDMLKKRREAGGVIGVPERIVFDIVQRY